ncbi:hypothetical protein VNO80_07286 [Phaseolus coccineus]|uniref:Uncharacterized protein n=1 Tax=Phaseolus coccineus TaxID=3886 RepID=A0AAN9RIC6_PHACN
MIDLVTFTCISLSFVEDTLNGVKDEFCSFRASPFSGASSVGLFPPSSLTDIKPIYSPSTCVPSSPRNLERLILDGSSTLENEFFQSIGDLSSLKVLSLSKCDINGTLPAADWFKLKKLEELNLIYNKFEGSLPSSFVNMTSLRILELSYNHFIGDFASNLASLTSLEYFGFKGNQFELPSRPLLKTRRIDVSDNIITGQIFGNNISSVFPNLQFLNLSMNGIRGSIPHEFSQMHLLDTLDLSDNSLSGNTKEHIWRQNSEVLSLDGTLSAHGYSRWGKSFPITKEKVNFTTKKTSYTYKGDILGYISGIDLSNNKLNGNIPSEFRNLTGIRALNLSYNDFIGQIPSSFSNLVQIESLDLSFNKLSGKIPLQLNRLSFLTVFSVAHDNLFGETLERKSQFITFDQSSYEDNPFLCGPSLPKSCNPYVQPHAISPNNSYTDEGNCSFVDMFVFWTSFGVSCTSVLLVIAATLYINPYWRRRWF